MKDILNLTDISIPISKRYDAFLLWSNQHPSIIADVIAEQLGVSSSVVDVYHQLGELEEEFNLIDQHQIDIDVLFILVRYDNPAARHKVYADADRLLKNPQPMKVIKEMLEEETIPDYGSVINQISPAAFKEIAAALEARGIDDGTINIKFRGMLKTAASFRKQNKEISQKMCDWLMRAINADMQKELRIFNSENLVNNHTVDYNHFETLRTQVALITTDTNDDQ